MKHEKSEGKAAKVYRAGSEADGREVRKMTDEAEEGAAGSASKEAGSARVSSEAEEGTAGGAAAAAEAKAKAAAKGEEGAAGGASKDASAVERSKTRLLPVGSVVAVNGVGAPLLIVGRAMRNEEGLVWDYMGAPYPEGVFDVQNTVVFSRDRIAKIYFIGLRSLRDDKLVEAIEKYLSGDKSVQWPPPDD